MILGGMCLLGFLIAVIGAGIVARSTRSEIERDGESVGETERPRGFPESQVPPRGSR